MKPDWTEQAVFSIGDDFFFVGVASCASSVEAGRQLAFEHARREVLNLVQTAALSNVQLRTERIYEERHASGCPPDTVTVWRLVRADRAQMIRFVRRWAEQHPLVEEEPDRPAAAALAQKTPIRGVEGRNDDPVPVMDLTERLRVLEEGGAGPVNRVMNAQFFAKTCPSAEGPAPALTAKAARRAETPPVEEESPPARVTRRSRWWMEPSRPLPPPSAWDGKVQLADVQPSPLARRSSLNVHLLGIPAEQLPYNFSLAFD